MLNEIKAGLKMIEAEEDLTILFACESGSRAWGFGSPDSDYDVRFIYLRPLSFYLQLQPGRDVIERQLAGDLDMAGWDLQKALRLFAQSNACLFEWLKSPIIYRQQPEFLAEMRGLIDVHLNPISTFYHYWSTAQKMWQERNSAGEIKIKKLFYVMRPLLAARWVISKREMPPITFAELRAGADLTEAVSDCLDDIEARKALAKEAQIIQVPQVLTDWIDGDLVRLKAEVEHLSFEKRTTMKKLDGVFLRYLGL